LVICGGTVVTAADVGKSDVGVRDGQIVALAASEIDASGFLVLPGGIDSHVHFDQPSGPGIVMADGFETGTRSAAAGSNTTVLSFALQPRGQSLRQSVLTDRQLLEVFTVAREHGALVMVHAEGYDQIKYMTDRLERDGKTHPTITRNHAPNSSNARPRTAQSRMPN
jgi:dihydropyrimidinase